MCGVCGVCVVCVVCVVVCVVLLSPPTLLIQTPISFCPHFMHSGCVWDQIGQAAGHSSPVGGGTGFCLLPPNDVEVAEVLGTEHVREDRTGGKRTNGTFNIDVANEMEMSAEKCATQILFVP